MDDVKNQLTAKVFLNNLLGGVAIGVVVALIPHAVLSAIFGNLMPDSGFTTILLQVSTIFQFIAPLAIGSLIAIKFGFTPMEVTIVAGAAFVGSGNVNFRVVEDVAGEVLFSGFQIAGIGDIINTLLTAGIAVGLILLFGNKLGSVGIIAGPMIMGVGAGLIGRLTLPFVSQITTQIGHTINHFTTLQPLLMSILISMSFAFIILSPLSAAGIAMAIGLNGVASGAAAMGVASVAVVLVINSWKVNQAGVTIAAGLGAMKMFMPNLFKHPIILLPTFFTAAIAAIPVALWSVAGTPESAGFGLVGLIGPLTAMDLGLGLGQTIIAWIIIPILATFGAMALFEYGLKLYKKEIVFCFAVKDTKE